MTTLRKLSLPKSITTQNDDDNNDESSFSKELLRQFDRQRSQLHFELGLISKVPSNESTAVDYSNLEPIQLDHLDDEEQDQMSVKRRYTATDLLRKSSTFLKSLFVSKKSQENIKQTKLIMKTTISVPNKKFTNNDQVFINSIPVITQYPPKPLIYSPVEPLPPDNKNEKSLFHRISMPLLHKRSSAASFFKKKSNH